MMSPNQLAKAGLHVSPFLLFEILGDSEPLMLAELRPQGVDGLLTRVRRRGRPELSGVKTDGRSRTASVGASLVVVANKFGEASLNAYAFMFGQVLADGLALEVGELSPEIVKVERWGIVHRGN